MDKTIFNMGTITNAMRAKSILDRHGYRCTVSRMTNRTQREGCGYSVLFKGGATQAEQLLAQSGLRIRGLRRADGSYE